MKRYENDDVAVGGARQHLINSLQYSKSEIYCFKNSESLIPYPMSLRVNKNQKLIIDNIIRRLFESGIIQKWKVYSQRRKDREIDKVVPFELKLEHIYAILFFFFLGAIVTIFVWIFELFIDKKVRDEPNNRLWLCIERSLDGKRHYFMNLQAKFERKFGLNFW